MYFDPDLKDHGLPFNPFKALVVPRPIGWISTVNRSGVVNLAPYSYFNACSTDPPVVLFGSEAHPEHGGAKHSQDNAETTGEFVVNIATYELRDQVVATSAPVDGDEMALVGLEKLPSVKVKPPRVAASPVHLECTYLQTVVLPANAKGRSASLVLGRVVGIHIRDDVIVDGRVDYTRFRPIARLGYQDYAVVNEVFEMPRPDGG